MRKEKLYVVLVSFFLFQFIKADILQITGANLSIKLHRMVEDGHPNKLSLITSSDGQLAKSEPTFEKPFFLISFSSLERPQDVGVERKGLNEFNQELSVHAS